LARGSGSETQRPAVSEGVDVLMSFTINNVEQSKPMPMGVTPPPLAAEADQEKDSSRPRENKDN